MPMVLFSKPRACDCCFAAVVAWSISGLPAAVILFTCPATVASAFGFHSVVVAWAAVKGLEPPADASMPPVVGAGAGAAAPVIAAGCVVSAPLSAL